MLNALSSAFFVLKYMSPFSCFSPKTYFAPLEATLSLVLRLLKYVQHDHQAEDYKCFFLSVKLSVNLLNSSSMVSEWFFLFLVASLNYNVNVKFIPYLLLLVIMRYACLFK